MDRSQQPDVQGSRARPALTALADRLGTRAPWPDPPGGRAGGVTKQALYEEARRRGVKGRSKMTKIELERALHR